MNYELMSDEDILKCAKENDNEAMEYLLTKYTAMVKKEIRAVYLIGASMDDLLQEGMIGIFKAIREYSDDKGAKFYTFATLCVRNQLKTAIKNSNRKKHTPLNTYISFYAENDEFGNILMDSLEAEAKASNPEAMIIAREQKDSLYARIAQELSVFEKKVLKYYIEGLSYTDIAIELSKPEKSIDNALQRIRKKLSK